MNSIAIVAPDTDAGKTVITAALVEALRRNGVKVSPMKPVQTGADLENGRRSSPDISTIESLAKITIPADCRHHVAPILLMTPCSPHLAARKEIAPIVMSTLCHSFRELSLRYRSVVVETAGGILSPLNEYESNRELVRALEIPALVVAPNRLGTISGTLAVTELLERAHIPCLGIVLVEPASRTHWDSEEVLSENVVAIQERSGVITISIPFLNNLVEDFDIIISAMEPFVESIMNDSFQQM